MLLILEAWISVAKFESVNLQTTKSCFYMRAAAYRLWPASQNKKCLCFNTAEGNLLVIIIKSVRVILCGLIRLNFSDSGSA